jgi:acetyltransferase EpsM
MGYFADKEADSTALNGALPVYLGEYDSTIYPTLPLVVAIGHNAIRETISKQVTHNGITLIHPRAVVSNNSSIGIGSVILANAVIQPLSMIGRFVIINAGAIIDHEAIVEDFVHIRPAAYIAGAARISSGVTVPPFTYVERYTHFDG